MLVEQRKETCSAVPSAEVNGTVFWSFTFFPFRSKEGKENLCKHKVYVIYLVPEDIPVPSPQHKYICDGYHAVHDSPVTGTVVVWQTHFCYIGYLVNFPRLPVSPSPHLPPVVILYGSIVMRKRIVNQRSSRISLQSKDTVCIYLCPVS